MGDSKCNKWALLWKRIKWAPRTKDFGLGKMLEEGTCCFECPDVESLYEGKSLKCSYELGILKLTQKVCPQFSWFGKKNDALCPLTGTQAAWVRLLAPGLSWPQACDPRGLGSVWHLQRSLPPSLGTETGNFGETKGRDKKQGLWLTQMVKLKGLLSGSDHIQGHNPTPKCHIF